MASAAEERRIAVVFRADLDMPCGKAEVQFGHAVARLIAALPSGDDYLSGSELKLSMECNGVDDLEDIALKAAKRGVPFAIIVDAGRTVFDGPTTTCIGLGPMNKTDCNALTRNARMR
jgi:peptidyl-tRNA hydrolase